MAFENNSATLQALKEVEEFPSQEVKLREFVSKCKWLFKESIHQTVSPQIRFISFNFVINNLISFQTLNKFRLSHLSFVRSLLSRVMFANAIVMCSLLVAFYAETPAEDPHRLRHLAAASSSTATTAATTTVGYTNVHADSALEILSVAQVMMAAMTLCVVVVNNLPVIFSSHWESSGSVAAAFSAAAFDPLFLWYSVYTLLAVLSVTVSRLFISTLLLDWIVLDTTTR